jgi:hypothetical protein
LTVTARRNPFFLFALRKKIKPSLLAVRSNRAHLNQSLCTITRIAQSGKKSSPRVDHLTWSLLLPLFVESQNAVAMLRENDKKIKTENSKNTSLLG